MIIATGGNHRCKNLGEILINKGILSSFTVERILEFLVRDTGIGLRWFHLWWCSHLQSLE